MLSRPQAEGIYDAYRLAVAYFGKNQGLNRFGGAAVDPAVDSTSLYISYVAGRIDQELELQRCCQIGVSYQFFIVAVSYPSPAKSDVTRDGRSIELP